MNNQFTNKLCMQKQILTVCFLRVGHLVSKLDVPRKILIKNEHFDLIVMN